MLRFETISLPSANWNGESRLPSIFPQKNVQAAKKRALDEHDELFWDLGAIPNILPYPLLNRYDRALEQREYEAAVLENDYLRAVFLPALGGKLWSLYDKKAGRELLYVNDSLRPANLALCNAWTSGGVEWNIGLIGHSPLTSRRLSTASLKTKDGQDVLRMYAFERVREVVYQMDFFLKSDAPVLLCRMRIKNLREKTIPMYWFSNIAVPANPGDRVLVRAKEAITGDIYGIGKSTVPVNESGRDVSYPEHERDSIDYFYTIPDRARKYIAHVNAKGQGMFQTSTQRQKGRKLFTWGQRQGGQSWQKWLTNKGGPYVEIQAGVNRTQYECIPMPPGCAWEWMEAYGPMNLTIEQAHGQYEDALKAAETAIATLVDEEALESLLLDTRHSLAKQEGQARILGEDAPWAALEQERRAALGQQPFETHLDFGKTGQAQRPWLALLGGGKLEEPEIDQYSFMVSRAWLPLIQKGQGWYWRYHEALNHFYRGNNTLAESMMEEALKQSNSPQAAYALGVMRYLNGDKTAAEALKTALPYMNDWVEFARDYLRVLVDFGLYQQALQDYNALGESARADGHVRYLYAWALAHTGDTETAKRILLEECAVNFHDLREGMTPLSDLWLNIRRMEAEQSGEAFDKNKEAIPARLDYRMA